MKKRFGIFALLVGLAVLTATPSAMAADLDIKAFFGKFEGGGVAKNDDSLYFGVTARDFDVTIEPEGSGFSVAWTSVIRGGGTPGNPDVRRKSSSLTFTPSGRPTLWRAATSGDPVAGAEAAWARISGNTLSVYLMVVRDDGAYEIQQYDRTLGVSGMELTFTRIRDGEEVRSVKGRLVKVAR